jgi:hypothetical protein
MTRTARVCRGVTFLLALVVGTAGGCGRNEAGPASGSDGGLTDTATPAEGLTDGGAPDTAPQVVAGWLARGFKFNFATTTPMGRSVAQVATENAAGDAPEGRLIFLLRVEDLGGSHGRFTFGLGEVVDPAIPGQYRFRADAPPTTLAGTLTNTTYVGEQTTAPLVLPLDPGGTNPPFTFVVGPNPGWDYTFSVEMTATSPYMSSLTAWITEQNACVVWIDGMNLLDSLDGSPTLGWSGSDAGSVDWDACNSWGPDKPPYRLADLEIHPFEAVQLVVSDG